MVKNQKQIIKRLLQAGQAFSPGAPINRYELFSGRIPLVKDVVHAINQRGHHVILYGERGVGKTSLASVMAEILETGVVTARVNSDASDDFESLWRKIFRELEIIVTKNSGGLLHGATHEVRVNLSEQMKNFPKLSPEDIRYLLEEIDTQIVIIIDEIDRLTVGGTTNLLADTIKTLSDHSVNTTLLLVGVADSVDTLIDGHQSIERSLIQVRMPRMSAIELAEILEKGYEKIGMAIDESAQKRIIKMSLGLPHYTHLLGLASAEAAIEGGKKQIRLRDVSSAIESVIKERKETIVRLYMGATASARQTLFPQVLLACALAKKDELGSFAPSDLRVPMTKIMKRDYKIPSFVTHLHNFCDAKRGPVLEKMGGARRFRFRFVNPLLEPYVLLHGLASNMLNEVDLI